MWLDVTEKLSIGERAQAWSQAAYRARLRAMQNKNRSISDAFAAEQK
jgi:hypothetical protein